MKYAIETVDLVKRYPTTSNRDVVVPPGRGGHARGNVGSITTILEAVRGSRGPFIEALKKVNLKIKEGICIIISFIQIIGNCFARKFG